MELQVLDQNVIIQAFATQGGSLLLVDRIAEEVRKHVPDVTTKKGRDAIGSLAAKVSKSKTLAEKYAKDLVAEEKARIKLVDDDRIQFVKRMDALRDEILAPRDAWEQAEKDRISKHVAAINEIKEINSDGTLAGGSECIKKSIDWLENKVVDSSFEEYEEQAKLAKLETSEVLRKALGVREKFEAEQAELERLRIAEQQRLQREHEEKIAREAAEKATREAEEKARFEAERVQREKAEAEQREARLRAEKEAAELRAQQAAENERKRIEAEQFAQAEAARKAEEARLANVEHRKQICSEALKGLTDLGLSVDQGKAVLNAINKGLVPHVSIKF